MDVPPARLVNAVLTRQPSELDFPPNPPAQGSVVELHRLPRRSSSRTTSPTSARRFACCSRARATPSRPPPRRPPCWPPCRRADFDAVLLDLNYARDTTTGREGLELVSELQALDATLPAVVMTAWGSVDKAVEAMRRGARDFIEKPWDNARLLATLRTQVELGRALRRDPAARGREPAAPARRRGRR